MKVNVNAYLLMQEIDRWLRKELRLPSYLPARDVIDISTKKLQGHLSSIELNRLWHLNYLRQDLMNYETISPSQLAYIHEVRKTLLALEDNSPHERNKQKKEKIYV
ncbi:hypothetical protein JCM19046_4761 [Bacillus sp. JCM 19046]|nr:hypothetical protein JCM19046_4761 [Bacillus sp. JCM 19046]